MLDRDIIQGRGFRNIVENGEVTGFQLQLRNPNYRGTAGSLLDGVEVVVDGERWDEHLPLWTLQGRTFTLDQLRASTGPRWQLDELATITVPKPGGLSAGVHSPGVAVWAHAGGFVTGVALLAVLRRPQQVQLLHPQRSAPFQTAPPGALVGRRTFHGSVPDAGRHPWDSF